MARSRPTRGVAAGPGRRPLGPARSRGRHRPCPFPASPVPPLTRGASNVPKLTSRCVSAHTGCLPRIRSCRRQIALTIEKSVSAAADKRRHESDPADMPWRFCAKPSRRSYDARPLRL